MNAQTRAPVLAGILESTRATLVERKRRLPPAELAAAASRAPAQPRFRAALSAPPIGAIAEFKRRSPSAGAFVPEPSQGDREDVRALARAYRRGGARAMSVLTEEPNFSGSLEDLRSARAASELPIIRKDFVIDSYQLHEALLAGADAVLLIVAALPPPCSPSCTARRRPSASMHWSRSTTSVSSRSPSRRAPPWSASTTATCGTSASTWAGPPV